MSVELCEQVLDLVGDRAEAQVLAVSGPSALTRFANSFIHQNVAEERLTVRLKVARDGRVASGSIDGGSGEALERLVESTLAAALLRPVDPDWPGLAPPAPLAQIAHYDDATAAAGPADRAALVERFIDAGGGLLGAGYASTEASEVAFANSAGQRATGRATAALLDGIHQTDDSAGKAHQASYRIGDLDGVGAGKLASAKARASAHATDLEPGRYEVILEPNCVATIAVFLCVYGFSAKAGIEGRSFVQVGEQQFDEAISLWDDATDPQALGLPFDAEGTPKRRLELVTAGVSRQFAQDRRTAAKLGTDSTGHATPGLESYGPIAGNLFVAPGDAAVDEMVASVERGLLVTEFNYCRILDPKTQVVTGLTRNGTFLVERGQIGPAVANLRFTQSFVDAMAPGRVLGVGSEARFADSEFGPGLVVAPAVRLAEWNFTGGARG